MPETPRTIPVRVECYAGHRGEETPRRIVLGDSAFDVAEIPDRWLAPDHRYFKIRTADEDTYILRQDTESGDWELVFYQKKEQ